MTGAGPLAAPSTAPAAAPSDSARSAASGWRHAANGAALVGILALAAVVLHTAPDRELQQSAIVVPGAVGEQASGRNIAATVHSVAVTETVTAGNGWAGSTPGVWVVVDLSVQALVDDQGAPLGTAVLRVGDSGFSASIRPGDATVAAARLATGIALNGPLMFELPADVVAGAAAGSARLELAANSDPRVDSLIVVPIDLSVLEVQPSLDVAFPERGSR
ncbi:hypothetical protein BJQ94_10395 [Cryobacterium sp. SO2]|uniref:hypothetical protein n=1 Tax=Cryobacterium sp. SO2 TaxID=1897060 RepID=UPI00223DFDB7|nr:hypothetical protein [Cryobacterium sp. SO2]WEO75795.1 hypothetical protein BJQ94_10395 [Cryobacterium sp. SO2]